MTSLFSLILLNLAFSHNIDLNPKSWQILNYSSIPAHKVEYKDSALVMNVESSAAPMIYPLKDKTLIRSFIVELDIEGSVKLDAAVKQGEEQTDDFLFRLGFVIPGKKTLGFLESAVAADWIKKLFSLAPKGEGVSHIEFYNLYNDPSLAGQSRVHPLSELLQENFEWPYTPEQPLVLKKTFNRPIKAAALWVSSDGDQTKSKFKVTIKKIALNE
jgi:hypothetical protein